MYASNPELWFVPLQTKIQFQGCVGWILVKYMDTFKVFAEAYSSPHPGEYSARHLYTYIGFTAKLNKMNKFHTFALIPGICIVQ